MYEGHILFENSRDDRFKKSVYFNYFIQESVHKQSHDLSPSPTHPDLVSSPRTNHFSSLNSIQNARSCQNNFTGYDLPWSLLNYVYMTPRISVSIISVAIIIQVYD